MAIEIYPTQLPNLVGPRSRSRFERPQMALQVRPRLDTGTRPAHFLPVGLVLRGWLTAGTVVYIAQPVGWLLAVGSGPTGHLWHSAEWTGAHTYVFGFWRWTCAASIVTSLALHLATNHATRVPKVIAPQTSRVLTSVVFCPILFSKRDGISYRETNGVLDEEATSDFTVFGSRTKAP